MTFQKAAHHTSANGAGSVPVGFGNLVAAPHWRTVNSDCPTWISGILNASQRRSARKADVWQFDLTQTHAAAEEDNGSPNFTGEEK
jgi:hypothetical protein